MMNTLIEIVTLQQQLLVDLVNTWNPNVKQKVSRLDDLFERLKVEQEIYIQKITESENRLKDSNQVEEMDS